MSCSLERENILTVTLHLVLNYLVASEFLLFFSISEACWLGWLIPSDAQNSCRLSLLFVFRRACELALHSHLRAVLIINIVLFKEKHLYRRLDGALLQGLCCSLKFQLLCKFMISGRRPRQCFLQTCDNGEQGNERWLLHGALCLVSESHRLVLVLLPSHRISLWILQLYNSPGDFAEFCLILNMRKHWIVYHVLGANLFITWGNPQNFVVVTDLLVSHVQRLE